GLGNWCSGEGQIVQSQMCGSEEEQEDVLPPWGWCYNPPPPGAAFFEGDCREFIREGVRCEWHCLEGFEREGDVYCQGGKLVSTQRCVLREDTGKGCALLDSMLE